MHASDIVAGFIKAHLAPIHGARRSVLTAVVIAALSGHCVSLTRLARGVMGTGCLKSALKQVDRFIGHPRIDQEARIVGRELLARLCQSRLPLVIAVDWSEVSPGAKFVELRAAVTRLGMGRALSVYEQVYELKKLGSAKAERLLLETLRAWVDPGVQVTVITDAGFRRPWFAQLQRMGWSWIGRVRRGVHISRDGQDWMSAGQCMGYAKSKAQRWSSCYLAKTAPWQCDMVLYRSRLRGRKHYRCAGHGSTHKAAKEARASAHEPLLLAHSPKLNAYRADEIVAMYAQRMQIEECFRDTKSVVRGMGFEIGRSTTELRLQALLMVAGLAAFLLWHIGQLGEAEGLHRRFKATTRVERELSLITLGILLCVQSDIPLSPPALRTLQQRLGMRA
jgi:Transposase DDE domain